MAIVRLEGLGQLKKVHLMGTRTRDLPVCSIVPQPTTLPRAYFNRGHYCGCIHYSTLQITHHVEHVVFY
jgi:hypothetical protein